jgi:hypothetical protein
VNNYHKEGTWDAEYHHWVQSRLGSDGLEEV